MRLAQAEGSCFRIGKRHSGGAERGCKRAMSGELEMTDKLVDMPTVDDLKAIARRAFCVFRGDVPGSKGRAISDLAFAQSELIALGMGDVYDAENRRSNLIARGFVPPEDLPSYRALGQIGW